MPTSLPTRSSLKISEPLRVVRPFAWHFAAAFAVLSLMLKFAPLPENFATFGALAFFCGLFLTGAMRWLFPIVVIFMGDWMGQLLGLPAMGFYYLPAMLFNYIALALFAAAGSTTGWLWNRSGASGTTILPSLPVGILCGSLLFFIVSNFGAWLDPRMGYEVSASGLVQSYWMGLPFWRASLASDMGFGLGFVAVAWVASAWLVSRAKAVA